MGSTKKTIAYLNSMDYFTSTTYYQLRVAFESNPGTPSLELFFTKLRPFSGLNISAF